MLRETLSSFWPLQHARVGEDDHTIEFICEPMDMGVVYMTGEAIPDEIVVSVGCFADPDFAPPVKLFWENRRHHWYYLA